MLPDAPFPQAVRTGDSAPPPSVRLLRSTVPRFYFETDANERCPIEFGGPPDVLVYFLSFAFSTRYGSQHELSKLALLLRGEHKIDLEPLLTFADRDVEEEADARELERVWQEAAPLAATLQRVNKVLANGDERTAALLSDAPDLCARLADLQAMAEWAEARAARVRMSFEL
jgi:hypothetical protein